MKIQFNSLASLIIFPQIHHQQFTWSTKKSHTTFKRQLCVPVKWNYKLNKNPCKLTLTHRKPVLLPLVTICPS